MSTSTSRVGGHLWAFSGTALVLLVVAMINFISARRYARWDFTEEGLFTLSERTEQVLAKLDQVVNIYLFIGSGDPLREDVKELIGRYKALSPQIQPHYVDPDREPARFRALAEKFGMRAAQLETGETVAEVAAIVTAGEKRWSINRRDLVSVDDDSFGGDPAQAKVDVKTEQALTGALVQVTTGRATRVCAVQGHGEWSLEGTERSLYGATLELKRENIEFRELELRGKEAVDKGCDAVWVVGPLKPLTESETKVLAEYVQGGGNLMLALDPVLEGGQLGVTGLEGLLGDFGLKVHQDVVVELDRARLLSASPVEHFLAADWGDHETVRSLATLGAPVVMHLARSFELGEGQDGQALLRSSDQAYGETELSALTAGDEFSATADDVQGPLVLAVALSTLDGEHEAEAQGGRVIVVGDSEWLRTNFLQSPEVANVDLLSAWTGWLTQREVLVSIAPRKMDALPILITEDALLGVFLRVVVLMPLSALILGVGIWWQRRA